MILKEIGGKKVSVQMNSTTDITAADQVSVVGRYVAKSIVRERLFAVVKARSSTGTFILIFLFILFIYFIYLVDNYQLKFRFNLGRQVQPVRLNCYFSNNIHTYKKISN